MFSTGPVQEVTLRRGEGKMKGANEINKDCPNLLVT